MLKRRFIFSVFFLFNILLHAQLPKMIHFNESSGFTGELIMGLHIDNDGYLWVVSTNGITKYDGKEFTPIKTNVDYKVLLVIKENHGQKHIIDLLGNVFLIQGDSLVPYPYNHIIDSLKNRHKYFDYYFDREGSFHFTTVDKGYCIIKNGEVIKPLEKEKYNNATHFFILTKEGNPFLSFKLKGNRRNIFLLDPELNIIDSIVISPKSYYYPHQTVQLRDKYIYWDGKGNLITLNNKKFLQLTPYDFPITNMIVDKQNDLWISTHGGGIHYYKDGIIDLEQREILYDSSQHILGAFDNEGGAWLISDKGLSYISTIHFRYYKKENGLLSNTITGLQKSGDSILIASRSEKPAILDEQNNVISHLPEIASHQMGTHNATYYDKKNNRFWVGSKSSRVQGVHYSENKKWKPFLSPNKKLAAHSHRFYDTKGCSCEASHIIVSTFNSLSTIFFMQDTSISKVIEDSKIEGAVLELEFLEGKLYLNTTEGLYYLENEQIKEIRTESINRKNSFMMEKFNQRIYVASGDGVYKIEHDSLTQLNLPVNNNDHYYISKVDSTELWFFSMSNTIVATQNSRGTVLDYEVLAPINLLKGYNKFATIAGKYGLYSPTWHDGILFQPYEHMKSQKNKRPHINRFFFEVNDTSYLVQDTTYQLKYNQNFIRFNYQLISFKNLPISYRYRLAGLGNKWTTSNKTEVQYTNLDPGNYEFEVQARKGTQLWSHPRKVRFTISPPFWETIPFIVFSGIILLGSTYWFIIYRIKIIHRENTLKINQLTAEQKALRAKMDPHFIFNVVSSLQYLIANKKTKKATKFLEQFSSLMRNTLNQTNQEFNLIEDEIGFLKEYIEMEKLRLENKFGYAIHLEPSVNRLEKIPNFIIQPFVENAIQHGLKNKKEQGFLSLHFSKNEDYLKVIIEDDGVGYNRTIAQKLKRPQKHSSQAIEVVKKRLELENKNQRTVSVVDIQDENPKKQGTRVSLYIKIKK